MRTLASPFQTGVGERREGGREGGNRELPITNRCRVPPPAAQDLVDLIPGDIEDAERREPARALPAFKRRRLASLLESQDRTAPSTKRTKKNSETNDNNNNNNNNRNDSYRQ